MTATETPYRISIEDYLEGEMISPIKHEYVRGQVYAIVGASDAHVTIVGNVFTLLRNHLRGTGCRAYMTDPMEKEVKWNWPVSIFAVISTPCTRTSR